MALAPDYSSGFNREELEEILATRPHKQVLQLKPPRRRDLAPVA